MAQGVLFTLACAFLFGLAVFSGFAIKSRAGVDLVERARFSAELPIALPNGDYNERYSFRRAALASLNNANDVPHRLHDHALQPVSRSCARS